MHRLKEFPKRGFSDLTLNAAKTRPVVQVMLGGLAELCVSKKEAALK